MDHTRPLFLPISEIKLQPPEWLIEGLIEANTLCGLVGASYSGKSFLALDMALSIASGLPFHEATTAQGSVLFIACEGNRGLINRIEAWCRSKGINRSEVPLQISQRSILMHDDQYIRSILDEVTKLTDVSLIVIDTLASVFGSYNENNTPDMNWFITNCNKLRDAGTSVVIVHHTGHNGERARGNSAFYAALDTEMRVSKNKSNVELSCSKMKDAEQFDPVKFRMVACDLGNDSSSVFLQKIGAKDKLSRLTQHEEIALKTFKQGTNANVPDSTASMEKWRELFYAGHTGDKEEAKKKAFQRARKTLVTKRYLKVEDEIYTLRDKGT